VGGQETSFPNLLISDPAFKDDVDAFVFQYYSPSFGPASNVEELAIQLNATLEDNGVYREHEQVAFLCHSMGGLVTRRALVLRHDLTKVAFIYFYATPTNGAEIADLASRLSSSPQLKSMLPLEGNEALQANQNDWFSWAEAQKLPSYCAYETLPTDGVFVVSQSSAKALCNHLPEPMTANHIQIVKPDSRQDPRYSRFATALQTALRDLPPAPSSERQPGRATQPVAATPIKAENSLSIGGTILRAGSQREPIERAVVSIEGQSQTARTDSDGTFVLTVEDNHSEGVTVKVFKEGYKAYERHVVPPLDQMQIYLEKEK
jgi:hypothetical protein